MGPTNKPIQDLADELGADVDAVHELLAALRDRAGAEQFYVFRTSGGAASSASTPRERTLLAFLAPDDALAFAQRNRLHDTAQPRLRRLDLVQMLEAVLRAPAIVAILFVAGDDEPAPPAGQLPRGVRIARDELLRWLRRAQP